MAEPFLIEPVPHDEARKWIAGKPQVSREVFETLLPELRARAFLISGLEDANVVAEIRELIAALPAGESWERQKKAIAEKLGAWFEPESSLARAELLLRTHGFQAYQAAQHRVMEAQADVFPYWQYLSLGDEKVRPAHRALDGIIVAADDPFWHDHSPPWQWGCRCRKVALLPDEVDDIKAEDAKRPPEAQRVLEGPALRKARGGVLDRGPAAQVDIRSDRMRGKLDGYHFDPSTLSLQPEQLKDRYDDTTWSEFEQNAKATQIRPGQSLWDWLETGKLTRAKPGKPPAVKPPPAAPVPPPAPPAPSQTGTAAGTPLTGKLEPVPKMPKVEVERVATVLGIIDRIHGDGPLTKIPVGNSPGHNNLGVFTYRRYGGGAVDIQFRRPRKGTYAHAELTLVHEVGHWLDYAGQGKNQFASIAMSSEMQAWWKAAQASASYKAIQSRPPSKARRYYLSVEEVWARCYAQFIAEESADSTLLQQVADIRGEPWPERQWATEDFAPLREEMRKIFEARGWMNPAPPSP